MKQVAKIGSQSGATQSGWLQSTTQHLARGIKAHRSGGGEVPKGLPVTATKAGLRRQRRGATDCTRTHAEAENEEGVFRRSPLLAGRPAPTT